jgi:hypothetical protein
MTFCTNINRRLQSVLGEQCRFRWPPLISYGNSLVRKNTKIRRVLSPHIWNCQYSKSPVAVLAVQHVLLPHIWTCHYSNSPVTVLAVPHVLSPHIWNCQYRNSPVTQITDCTVPTAIRIFIGNVLLLAS